MRVAFTAHVRKRLVHGASDPHAVPFPFGSPPHPVPGVVFFSRGRWQGKTVGRFAGRKNTENYRTGETRGRRRNVIGNLFSPVSA